MHTFKTSRRSFIKASLAAGVAPMFLPGRLWAAETKPNDRITLGMIGMGKMNLYHLEDFLRRDSVQVLAVCDVDTNRREEAKRRTEERYSQAAGSDYKGCAAYKDFRELLQRKDIDAVVVATPDHWHALIDIAAAEAGKDIYAEKPVTETIHEAWALVNAVRKNNRIFQVGSQQRSAREFRVACELTRNGVIGKIVNVAAGVGGPAKPCDLPEEAAEPGLDWDLWLGPAPLRPYNSMLSPRGVHDHYPLWRNYREYGGGGVTDFGAHHYDIALWGCGFDEMGPLEVILAADPTAKRGVKLKFPNDIEIEHANGGGITFHGTDGDIFVDRGRFSLTIKGQDRGRWLTREDTTPLPEVLDAVEKEFLPDPKIKLYRSLNHKDDWLSAIRSRQKPVADVAIGANTVTACHLVNLAYYHQEKMKWDTAKHAFAEGTGKPEWLTREYRGPWKV